LSHGTLEIEHKFVVEEDFDVNSFFKNVRSLSCDKEFSTEVTDTYYFNRANRDFVLRHRKDDRIEQLSYKSTGTDAEIRTELNLNLAMGKNSVEIIAQFCQRMGLNESAPLKKSVRVFEFSDVEIVHYVASLGQVKVRCVEFESTKHSSPEMAKQNIRNYEAQLGFDAQKRESRSLFDLLVLPLVAQNGSNATENSSAMPKLID
jgi:predicted adenylyl cyclase CyaB